MNSIVMPHAIKSFIIKGLFRYRDVHLDFTTPYKIIVGENGLGKTTIINSLYYTLSKKFDELAKIKFRSIKINFEKTSIEFSHYEIECLINREESSRTSPFYRLLENKLRPQDIRKIIEILNEGIVNSTTIKDVISIIQQRGISASASDDFIFKNATRIAIEYVSMHFTQKIEILDRLITFDILYFPTYRRVESSFNTIASALSELRDEYPFYDEDDLKRIYHTELIKFGMGDVKDSIEKLKKEISEQTREGFQKVLGEMLSVLAKTQTKPLVDTKNFNEDKIIIILSRLGDAISPESQGAILDYANSPRNKESRYLDYLISKLIDLYEDHREQDDMIKNFVATCNNYLFDKQFVYNEGRIDLYLESFHDSERLDLDCLSSGEKQIVSLFAKIFLEKNKPFMILFDEPELSLSMRWQKRLLPDIIKSGKCVSLLAATHSPFIFENEMHDFAVALSDYMG